MTLRPAIAALIALAAATSGCTSLDEPTISLVAQKPVLQRWPFKRPVQPQPDNNVHRGDSRQPPQGGETLLPEPFLKSLAPQLRERIESELDGATADERQRLLSYLATVEPDRIPALLDARGRTSTKATPDSAEVVQASAAGTPAFDLTADEAEDRRVAPASAQTAPSTAAALFNSEDTLPAAAPDRPVAPIARPRRNPLIEIQGVEFDEAESPAVPQVTPASSALLEQQMEPPSAVVPESADSPSTPPGINPLARLREWTTIRRPDAAAAGPQGSAPVASADALSLQGLSRRLRAAPKVETASVPIDNFAPIDGQSPHLHDALQRLIALMEAETARLKPGTSFAEREEYVRKHAELRMLLLMTRQPALALQAIPDVDPETQEFWTSLMWSMSDYFDNQSSVDPSERASAALERLRAADRHLQALARLELGSLTFCEKIDGFGSYQPFERTVFRPGQPVLLYAEVRNFKTEITAAGRYRTSLKSTMEIVRSGGDGELIERRRFESTEDQSRSPRVDYFHSYKLDLPLHLTPGSYTLKLTLEDELSGKIGSSSIDFLVR